jgi:hypothetical protein
MDKEFRGAGYKPAPAKRTFLVNTFMQNEKARRTIFYSWQSDLPNATNRGFIEDSLNRAAKAIHGDDSIRIEPVIDRDITGVPGSPDIDLAILRKIEQADIVVCDVSIINHGQIGRPTPNPNVLIECGYALKALGWERLILVMNTVYGGPRENLPFDLSRKHVVTYEMPEEQADRATERKGVAKRLEVKCREIFTHIVAEESETSTSLRQRAIDDLAEDLSWAIHNLLNKPVSNKTELSQWESDYRAWCQRVSAKLEKRAFFTRADQLHFDRLGFVPPANSTGSFSERHEWLLSQLKLKFERLRDVINWTQIRKR